MATSQLSEGFVYAILHRAKASDDIPDVYSSGIICQDSFGYRIEYVIMKDCGETLLGYVLKLVRDKVNVKDVCDQLLAYLKDAVVILGNVYTGYISHCSISPSNLTIDNKGKLRVTGWCHAKISSTLLEQVAAFWWCEG